MDILIWLVLAIIIGCSLGIIVINVSDKIEEHYREEDDIYVEEF